jgi:hypothetical protein
MEQVRSAKLDEVCEGLAESRAGLAISRENEQSWMRQAIKIMQELGIKGSYKHGGVEVSLVPGGDKLRVRMLKEVEETDPAEVSPPGSLSRAGPEAPARSQRRSALRPCRVGPDAGGGAVVGSVGLSPAMGDGSEPRLGHQQCQV